MKYNKVKYHNSLQDVPRLEELPSTRRESFLCVRKTFLFRASAINEIEHLNHAKAVVGMFFSKIAQPTKMQVKRAIVYCIHITVPITIKYILSVQGDTKSSSNFVSSLSVQGVTVIKEWSTDFQDILITREEVDWFLFAYQVKNL